jgi:hypothetical protein
MKAILEFNLPEDQDQFEQASKGMDWALAMLDLDNWLRSKLKYEELDANVNEVLTQCRDELHEFMQQRILRFPS